MARSIRLFPITFAVLLFLVARTVSAATVAGTVVDPDGRAVPNVRVVLTTALGTAGEAITDQRGAYEMTRIAAGRYELFVIAGGLQADPVAVSLADSDRREVQVQLRVSAIAESVVVSAAQIDLPASRAAARVTVIPEAELKARQVTTVADALRMIAGLSIARSGGRGAITSLFTRGGGSNYTLVLVDGMRVNAFGGGFDFAHLSAADVERIEIARGPQSALFGSDAISGVVQIVTKRGGRPRVEGLAEGGSQGTARAAVDAAGSGGDWTWGAGVERSGSDGYTGVAPNGETVSNDDDHLTRATGSVGWRRPSGADLLVSMNVSRDERGFPGAFGSDPRRLFSGVDRVSRGTNDTRQIGARLFHPWSSTIRQRVEASYTDLAGDFQSRFGPSASGSRRFDSRIQEDVALAPSIGASGGLEFIRERGTSTYVTGAAGQEIPIERAVVGLYGELRIASRERLFVTGGVRVDRLTREAVEADPLAFQPRPAFADQTIASFNPKIALSYVLTPPDNPRSVTRIRASAGTGIRPPNAFEVAFTDNPDLRPERSRSAEVGLEQHLAGGAYSFAATGFFNRYDDLIVTLGRALGGASRYRTDNISNSRARGLELSADVRLSQAVAAHGAYTFLSTEILSADGIAAAPAPFRVGDALVRRPRHTGAATVTFNSSRLTAFTEILQRGRTLDLEPSFASSTFMCPGFTVLNAGLGVPVGKRLQVFARLLNLTDRAYEETLGYPALRRSAILGVRVAASR